MKKLHIFTILLSIVLTGCSGGKPGNDDLEKSFNESFQGFKRVGVDMGQYLKASNFEVLDSYKEGRFYVVKAIPTIKIIKNLDAAAIEAIEEKTGMLSGHIIQVVNMFEIFKKYNDGELDEQKMMQELRLSQIRKPEGTLTSGDEINGLASDYKFRKTDNGWMAVE